MKISKLIKCTVYSHNVENTTGWDDEFVSYLLKQKVPHVVKVSFPFYNSTTKSIKVFYYKNNKITRLTSRIKFYKPELISYGKDFIYGLYYGFKYAKNSDLFVGMDNLLVVLGIILRKLGIVNKVVYCMIDYTPVRYKNSILNKIYYLIDKFACSKCDIIWPLTREMIEGRAEAGIVNLSKIKYFVTPSGNNSDMQKPSDYNKYTRNIIVYFGSMVKSKGAELFVPLVEALISKGLKNFTFTCIGPGEIDLMKMEAVKKKIDKYFKFYGIIKDHREIEKMLLKYGVAIAPYYPVDKNNYSFYADPGKLKVYLGCGLPVVTTAVPPIAKIISARNAGEIAKYSANDFAEKILKIITTDEYINYRKNAIELGKEYAWNSLFKNAIYSI